jgi:hypothetical protein
LIDADVVDKWLNLLEGYFLVHNFSDWENITFALLKVILHVKYWLLSLCNFLEVEKEEIHKGNLNQPLLKLGSSPSSFREGSLYLV